MNIIVSGSPDFNDYATFLRGLGVAMSDLKNDQPLNVYSVGPQNVNRFTAEFCNKISDSMAQRGHKVRFFKIPVSQAETILDTIDWFGYFSSQQGRPSKLFYEAQTRDIDCALFRY